MMLWVVSNMCALVLRYARIQSHSEHGYVYYSWTESETFAGTMYPVKGLTPNTVRCWIS